jgi:hypothetical protein
LLGDATTSGEIANNLHKEVRLVWSSTPCALEQAEPLLEPAEEEQELNASPWRWDVRVAYCVLPVAQGTAYINIACEKENRQTTPDEATMFL